MKWKLFLGVAPIVSCDASGTRIRFKCEFATAGEASRDYEVIWFYTFNGKVVRISQEILKDNQNVTYIENTNDTEPLRRFRVGYTVRNCIFNSLREETFPFWFSRFVAKSVYSMKKLMINPQKFIPTKGNKFPNVSKLP